MEREGAWSSKGETDAGAELVGSGVKEYGGDWCDCSQSRSWFRPQLFTESSSLAPGLAGRLLVARDISPSSSDTDLVPRVPGREDMTVPSPTTCQAHTRGLLSCDTPVAESSSLRELLAVMRAFVEM